MDAANIGAGTAVALGQFGPQIALPEEVVTVPAGAAFGYLWGSRVGAATSAFELEAGYAYDEFSKIKDTEGNPLDEDVAKVAAIGAGALNAGLEMFALRTAILAVPGGERLLGQFSRESIKQLLRQKTVQEALKRFTIGYGKVITAETITEVAQEAVTIFVGEMAKSIADGDFQSTSAEEIGLRLQETAVKTAQAMTLLAAPGPGTRFAIDTARAERAQLNVKILEALGKNAEESKLRERIPKRYQEFVQRVAERGDVENIYVEREAFLNYWKEAGIGVEGITDVLKSLGVLDQIEGGVDIVIPLDKYLSVLGATEHHAGLIEDLRLFKDDMSVREAKEFYDTFLDEASEVSAEVERRQVAAQTLQKENDVIQQDIKAKLVGLGRTEEMSEVDSAIAAAWYTSMATRLNMSPAALYEAQQLAIEKLKKAEGLEKIFGRTLVQALEGDLLPQAAVLLASDARLGTVAHEFGHLFFSNMFVLTKFGGVSGEVAADFQKWLKWTGAKTFQTMTKAQHERSAVAFEAYLKEGKAPAKELESVFQRFKEWLVRIYDYIRRYNVELTPELREVFDRMLASHLAVNETEAFASLDPLFKSAEAAGMSETEFADYQKLVALAKSEAEAKLQEELFKSLLRKQKAEYAKERREVLKGVTEELSYMQVYQAMYYLEKGELRFGETPKDLRGLKISLKYLKENYEVDIRSALPKNSTRRNGIHPDDIASLFGYESGAAMIADIAKAVPLKDRAAQEADKIMAERYPDPQGNVAALREEAAKATLGAKRYTVLMAELRTLAKRARLSIPPIQAIRQRAEVALEGTLVTDVEPRTFIRESSRNANACQRALKMGKLEEAVYFKILQIRDLMIGEKALKTEKQIQKATRGLAIFTRKNKRADFGKVSVSALAQLDTLMYRFGLTKVVPEKKEQSLSDWIRERRAEGYELIDAPFLLDETYSKPYHLLTVKEFSELSDFVRSMNAVVLAQNKLLKDEREGAFQEAVDEIAGPLNEEGEPPQPVPMAKGVVAEFLGKIHAAHTKMEFLFRELDGDKPMGPIWTRLFLPFAEAEDAENKMMTDATKRLTAIFGRYSKKERRKLLTEKIYVPEVGRSFTRANLLIIALNSGNVENLEALKAGYKWNNEQLLAIYRLLDKRDWDTVQEIWDYFDEFWPAISEMQRKLTGISPKKVEPKQLIVPAGTYRGGYFPLRADYEYSSRVETVDTGQFAKDLFSYNFMTPQTKKGHTKERVGFGDQVVSLNLHNIFEHVTDVIHDLTHREVLIDTYRLIQNKRVRAKLVSESSPEMYRQIKLWLKDIANLNTRPSNYWEKILSQARVGATAVALGFKMTTTVAQVLGFTQTIDVLGVKATWDGVSRFFSLGGAGLAKNMQEQVEFVMSRSVMMQNRRKTFDREISSLPKRMFKDSRIQESLYYFLGMADMAVAVPTWLAAYNKALAENGGNEKKAVDFSDHVVRISQGTGRVKDLAGIQRGGELARLFTMFYTYFSVAYNLFARSGSKLAREGQAGIPRFLASMMFLWFMPAILSELLVGRGPEDDENWALWAARTVVSYPFNAVIGLRDISSAVFQGYDYRLSPTAAVFSTMAQLGEQVKQGEIDRQLLKTGVTTIGYWGKLPTGQMWITGEGFYDFLTDPKEAKWHHLLFAKQRHELKD